MPTLNPKKVKKVKWTDENIQQHPYVAATLKKLFETEEELEETKKVSDECVEAYKRLMKLYKQLKSKVEGKIKEEEEIGCDNKDCIGGRAFDIRGNMFCSPFCGNEHFNLKEGDSDYWKEDEEEEYVLV